MVDKNGKAQEGKQDMPDQNRSGARDGQGASGGSSQSGGGEGAGRSRQSGFIHSSPDANVFPAGAPQSDRGDAGSRASSAARAVRPRAAPRVTIRIADKSAHGWGSRRRSGHACTAA